MSLISLMGIFFRMTYAVILLGCTTSAGFSQGMMMRGQTTTLEWHSNEKAAFKEASQKNLPIIAVFR